MIQGDKVTYGKDKGQDQGQGDLSYKISYKISTEYSRNKRPTQPLPWTYLSEERAHAKCDPRGGISMQSRVTLSPQVVAEARNSNFYFKPRICDQMLR